MAASGRTQQLGFLLEAVFDQANHRGWTTTVGGSEPFDQQDRAHEHDAVFRAVGPSGGEVHAVGCTRRAAHVTALDGDLSAMRLDVGGLLTIGGRAGFGGARSRFHGVSPVQTSIAEVAGQVRKSDSLVFGWPRGRNPSVTQRGNRHRGVRQLAIFLALALPFVGSRAAARPDPMSLHVILQGEGRGCLSERALERRIAHYLAKSSSENGGFDVRVRARADGHTEFELTRSGRSIAVRAFPTLPEACAERVDAIAIAIAIAMEQADSPASAPAEPAPEPVQPPAASDVIASAVPKDAIAYPLPADARETTRSDGAPPADAVAHASPAEAREITRSDNTPQVRVEEARAEASLEEVRRDTPPSAAASTPGQPSAERVSLRAGAGVLFGLLPSPVIAALVGGDIAIFDSSIYVSVSAMLTGQTRNDLATGQVKAQIAAGRGALCYLLRAAWVSLCACPGIAIGGYITRGDNYDSNRNANLPWAGAFGHTGLRVFDGALKLELSVEGYVNFVRPSLWVEGTIDEPLTTPVFAASSTAELLVVF